MSSSFLTRASLFATFAVTTTLAGCGPSVDAFGPTPDATALRAQLRIQDGSFPRGGENALLSVVDKQMLAATIVPGVLRDPPFVSPQSPDIFNSVAARWSDLCKVRQPNDPEACGCPDGGRIVWNTQGVVDTQLHAGRSVMRITLSGCTVSGVTEDGVIFVQVDALPAGAAGSIEKLVDYHTTVTAGGQATKLDFDIDFIDSAATMNVRVPDGHVMILQQAPGAPAEVYARDGVFSCSSRGSDGGPCVGQ
jgi:hypothetical protein